MGLFDGGFLGGLFKKGATELTNSLSKGLDNLFTNDEERAAKANELARIKAEMEATVLRHMEEMQKLAMRENELENADRDSARNREIAHIKATGKADHFQYFVGGVVMVCFIGVIIFLLNREVPEKNGHIVINLVGILEGAVLSIITFYFGSSRGSREKQLPTK